MDQSVEWSADNCSVVLRPLRCTWLQSPPGTWDHPAQTAGRLGPARTRILLCQVVAVTEHNIICLPVELNSHCSRLLTFGPHSKSQTPRIFSIIKYYRKNL